MIPVALAAHAAKGDGEAGQAAEAAAGAGDEGQA
jgi:hypothetical protein